MHSDDGQAAVELVALLPLIAAVLLVAWQFVIAGDARSSAAVAARAAARAAAVGANPADAAHDRIPAGLRRGLRVRAGRGGAVTVSVRVPTLAGPIDLGRIAATASLEVDR